MHHIQYATGKIQLPLLQARVGVKLRGRARYCKTLQSEEAAGANATAMCPIAPSAKYATLTSLSVLVNALKTSLFKHIDGAIGGSVVK